MSKQINLGREITKCEDCEIYKDCKIKNPKHKKCFRKTMCNNFDKIYNDDTEEGDDL